MEASLHSVTLDEVTALAKSWLRELNIIVLGLKFVLDIEALRVFLVFFLQLFQLFLNSDLKLWERKILWLVKGLLH